MEIAFKVLIQVVVILILIGIGFGCAKSKMITHIGVKQMTSLLLNVVTPCVLIDAYQEKTFSMELAGGLLSAALFTFLSILVTTLLSKLIFRKEQSLHYRIHQFASVYSNCGFMAIPLLGAALGPDGVFYGSAYLAVFTILYWTMGVYVFTENIRSFSVKSILMNPGVIGTVISILFFIAKVQLPSIIRQPISFLADINTPLAMIILGTYLVHIHFSDIIHCKGIYLVSLLRLLVYPLISLGLCILLRLDPYVANTVMISSACPTAAVATLFATKFGLDAEYSAQIVAITTILSIFTIPLMIMITGLAF